MLQEYQDRMETLGQELEKFADQFSEQHPELSHQVEDTLVHLKKAEEEVAGSLSEWVAYGELRTDEMVDAVEARISRFESLLKAAIAKF
jgi:uncharacterized protein YaaN involved in tellurite resistance